METADALPAGGNWGGVSPHVRRQSIEFLIASSLQLGVPPIVKYTALALFADRFLCALPRRKTKLSKDCEVGSWLINPLRESNLHLFALVSVWISSKLHDTHPLSVKSLKSLGDRLIKDQHFTSRDFVEAELVFMEVLGFEIGASNITFTFLEELLIQFRELSRVGKLLSFNLCMEIMDLLYETEETSLFYHSPCFLAASILAASYVLTVPEQRWEFPLLPWVKVVTSYTEDDIGEHVENILRHVLKPGGCKQTITGSVLT